MLKFIPPPVYALLGLLAEWFLASNFPLLQVQSDRVYWFGIAVGAAGALLSLTAVALFLRARTTLIPHKNPGHLVTSGPYRFTRNPMYLSLLLIELGGAIALCALSPFVVPILFFLIIDRVFIQMEERHARETFGQEYEQYTQRVARWL